MVDKSGPRASKKPVKNVRGEVDEAYSSTTLMNMPTINVDISEWSWKRNPEAQAFRVVINNHCIPEIIEIIKRTLGWIGQGAIEEFRRSCFGRFLLFNGVNYSVNSCVHQLLTHEVIRNDVEPNEKWFRIGETFTQFSKYEFALVMGLKFGDLEYNPNLKYSDLPTTNLFRRYYIGNREKIRIEKLKQDFIGPKFDKSPSDAVKVAKLLFYLQMLAGIGKRRVIPIWLWDLAENSKRWDEFAWGTITYKKLLEGMDRVPTWSSPEDIGRIQGPDYRYHLYGCSIALTIWAYEAMPIIGHLFGKKCDSAAILRPRILRWTFKEGVPKERSDEVCGMFSSNQPQILCLHWLRAEECERDEFYWQGIHCRTYDTRLPREQSPDTATDHLTSVDTGVILSPNRRQSRSPPAWVRSALPGSINNSQGPFEQPPVMFNLPAPPLRQPSFLSYFGDGANQANEPPHTFSESAPPIQANETYDSPAFTNEPHPPTNENVPGPATAQTDTQSDGQKATYPHVQCPCIELCAELKGEVQQVGLQLKSFQTSLDKLNDRVETRVDEVVEEIYNSESQMMYAFQRMHEWMWSFVSDDAFRVLSALSKKSHRKQAKIVDAELGAPANVVRPEKLPEDQFQWTNTVRPKIGRSTLHSELPKMSPFSPIPKKVADGLCKFIKSSESMMLNNVDHVDAQWFKDLLNLDSDLLNTHVDVFLRIMNEDPTWYCNDETPFLEDMAFMPMDISIEYMNLFNLCKGSINELSDQQISSLVDNALGNCYSWNTKGRAWKDVKYVCLVASFNKHFYACKAELRTGMLFVYDSLHFKWTEENLVMRQDQTRVYRTLIPLVMEKIKYRETHLDTVSTGEFTFLAGGDRDTYRQEDNESCGIYAMLHVYSWARGKMSGLCRHKQNLPMIREEMTIKFYQYILSKQGQTPPQ